MSKLIGKYTSSFNNDVCLGNGGFGSVYIGYEVNNPNNKVAIKVVKIGKQDQKQIMNQALNMMNASSQGTVKVYATGKVQLGAKNQDHFAMVMEYMEGSLKDLLDKKNKLSQTQAVQWIKKIVKCYQNLYDCKIIHRDLKPDNILYKKGQDGKLIFKICDFGLSRDSTAQNKSLTIGKGSLCYVSPQQAKKGHYTDKTDVYALGSIFFELLNGVQKSPIEADVIDPYTLQFDHKKYENIMKGLNVSIICMDFIEKCLAYEQAERYSWKDIFSHKIFSGSYNMEVKNNQTKTQVLKEQKFYNQNIQTFDKQFLSKYLNLKTNLGTVLKCPINTPIPSGWRRLTKQEGQKIKKELNQFLETWTIVAFKNGKIDGFGYGNNISNQFGSQCNEMFLVSQKY